MAFLAVKDEGIFIFNTVAERIELKKLFFNKECKSFLSNEKYKAICFAGINKTRGFSIDDGKNFIPDLEKIEKDNYIVKVSLVTGKEFFSVFKSFPYLCTNKILKYDYISKQLNKELNFGTDIERVTNFENKIQDYQILTDIARRTATESYIYAFKAKFGFSPWKLMEKHDILRDSTRLKFGKICDNFVFKDNEIKQINSKINIEIFHKDIIDIEPLTIGLQFKENVLVDLIESIEYD